MENINITRLFPGWRIVRMIGRGSFGTVYEIAKERLGETEKAALKVISIPNESGVIDELRLEGYDDASIKKRFESDLGSFVKEYKNMRMLTHTNIVNCDDIEYEESADGVGYTMYIKMELLTPLMSVINKSTDVEKLALDLAKDICSALVLCESRNVVHRDIKPWNLFVNEYGEYKLGDFGIARQMDHTTNATRIGTCKYMAPEVYNNQPYGHNVDIYSLGLVLYWILNDKRLPFLPLPPAIPTAQQEADAQARRRMGDRLPAPKRGSQHLKSIVLKACEADPKYRYQTASEMLKDLQSADNESPDFSVSGVPHGAPVENKVNGGTNNNGTQREYSSFDDYYTKNGQADYTDSTMGNAWSDGEKTSAAQKSYGSYSANNRSSCTDRTMGNSRNDGGKTEAKPNNIRSNSVSRASRTQYSSAKATDDSKTIGVKNSNTAAGQRQASKSDQNIFSKRNAENDRKKGLEMLRGIPVPDGEKFFSKNKSIAKNILRLLFLVLFVAFDLLIVAIFVLWAIYVPWIWGVNLIIFTLIIVGLISDRKEKQSTKITITDNQVDIIVPKSSDSRRVFALAVNGSWYLYDIKEHYSFVSNVPLIQIMVVSVTLESRDINHINDLKVKKVNEIKTWNISE